MVVDELFWEMQMTLYYIIENKFLEINCRQTFRSNKKLFIEIIPFLKNVKPQWYYDKVRKDNWMEGGWWGCRSGDVATKWQKLGWAGVKLDRSSGGRTQPLLSSTPPTLPMVCLLAWPFYNTPLFLKKPSSIPIYLFSFLSLVPLSCNVTCFCIGCN